MGIETHDPFWIKCSSCGNEYTLLLVTVCPRCFQRPKRDGSDRINQVAAVEKNQQ